MTTPPPLPSGYKAAQNASSLPPLPAGYSMASPAQAAPAQSTPAPSDNSAQPPDDYLSKTENFISDAENGLVKSAGQTVGTVAHLLHKARQWAHPGQEDTLIPEQGISALDKGTELHGGGEYTGAALENIAEFALGDEALKGLSLSQKLSKVGPLVKALENHPRIAKVLDVAIRQGAVATGQGLAHGETPGTAAQQGLLTAGTGLAFEGLSRGASKLIGRNAATMEKVGGVDTVIPADVRNARPTPQQAAGQEAIKNSAQDTLAGHLEEVNASRAVPPPAGPALPARTGPYEFSLQGTGPVETTTGESVVPAAKLPRENVSSPASARNAAELGSAASTVSGRVAGEEAYMTSAAPKPAVEGAVGTEGADVATSTPRETETATTGGGGTLKTQDPNVVKGHIANLNEIIDHPDFEQLPPEQQHQLVTARSEAQRQLSEYHSEMEAAHPRAGRPNFDQINIPEAVKSVGSYTEAAQYLENIATEGYNSISDALALNDISGGKFATIRNANREAWNAYKGASSVEAMAQAENAIDSTNQQMMDLLHHDIQGAVSPKELDGFNAAYSSAQKLKFIGQAVDSSFSGNASSAARSWEYRGFDGNRLMANLNRLNQKFGRNSLERLMGKDSLDTMYQVAELNRTGAARARFGTALQPIAEWLTKQGSALTHLAPIGLGGLAGELSGLPHGWMLGAAAGEATAMATRKVMNMVLSNPKIAQNLIFAIDSGARPQYYGPMIGAMIQSAEKAAQQTDQQGEDNQ